MRRYLATLMMGAALLAPAVALRADDHHKDRDDQRYYDPYKRDYHQWNNDEDRAYRHWLTEERHEQYRDYNRAKKAQQRDYWRWRHEHMDWH